MRLDGLHLFVLHLHAAPAGAQHLACNCRTQARCSQGLLPAAALCIDAALHPCLMSAMTYKMTVQTKTAVTFALYLVS